MSKGRSIRGLVGFDRSGSAVQVLATACASSEWERLTNDITLGIAVFKIADRLDGRDFSSIASCCHRSAESCAGFLVGTYPVELR